MRLTTITIVLSLAVAGCSSGETEMKAAVAEQLKDPESARFTEVSVQKTKRGTRSVMCGNVNAKNSYGGYGEPMPFTVIYNKKTGSTNVATGGAAYCKYAFTSAEGSEMLESI